MMTWKLSALVMVCVVAGLGVGGPASAHASGGWRWPVDGAVTLAYGERYTAADGSACTHGGVDLCAPEGSVVRACDGGEVAFSGPVPAGEGARAWAVTVLTSDGLRVTYLPLESGTVSKGARVDAGATLGTLAGTGDASGAGPHLHLGVRRGETRLDPMAFFGERAGAIEEPAAPPVPAPRPAAPVAPVAPPIKVEAHVAPPSPVHVNVPAGVPASASARAGDPAPSSAANGAPLPLALMPSVPLPSMPPLARVPSVAETPRVRVSAVAGDLASARGFLAAVLGCLGLTGVAGACVWPALRGVLDGSAGRQPATVQARGDGA